MRLILLGPPGAGKGSLAQLMRERYELAHVASGDLLREAAQSRTPLGAQAQEYMQRGQLAPDELVTAMVLERLSRLTGQGFVLDGFPRTRPQAEKLDQAMVVHGTPVELVVYCETTPEMVVFRLTGRRVCRTCARVYHVKNWPPKREGICDACGGPLTQREDDCPETVAKRLKVYEAQTAPLLAYYRDRGALRVVDGNVSIEESFQALDALLRKERLLAAG